MKAAAYCLTPHGLLRLLSYRTQDFQPMVAPPTMVGPSTSLPIKKMSYKLAYGPISGRHFLNLLSDDSSLC